MEKEEVLLRLSMLENEAKQFQEQAELVNQQIAEFEILKRSLEKINKDDEKEFLAPLGKGVFVKSEMKEKELFVNIGQGIVIRKNPEDAVKIIDRQVKQLENLGEGLIGEIEKLNMKMRELIKEIETN